MAVYFSYFPNVKHTGEMIKNITLRAKINDYTRSNPRIFLPYTVEDDLRPEDVALHYYGSVEYTWLVLWSNNIIDPYYDWVMNDDNLHRHIFKKYFDCVKAYYADSDYVDNDYAIERDPTYQEVLSFTQNAKLTENIVEYRRYDDDTASISRDSYDFVVNYQVSQGAPTTSNRADGLTSLKSGDVYLDETSGTHYVWNSDLVSWEVTNLSFVPSIIHSEWYPIRFYEWEIEQNENRRHIELVDKVYLSQIKKELKAVMNV